MWETRPPTLDEFAQYSPYHKKRLSFRPGLTGMWQVSGRSDITDFEEIVKLDVEYIDNWSFWLDIKILLKTFLRSLHKRAPDKRQFLMIHINRVFPKCAFYS